MKKPVKLDPSILVIAGVTGDLARRYLLPALSDLIAAKMIPDNFKIVGLSRREVQINKLLDFVDKPKQAGLKERFSLCVMDISKLEDYKIMRTRLDKIEDQEGMCMHRLYYLAIPAKLFPPVIDGLGTH